MKITIGSKKVRDPISGQFLQRLWNQQRYFGIGPNSIRKTSMNCMIGIEIRPVYMTPSSKRWKIVLKRIRNKLHHLHRLLIITCLRSYMMCRHLLYSIMLQRAMGIRQEKSGNQADPTLLRLFWVLPTKQTMHCKNLQKLSPVAPKNFEKYESYLLEVQNLFWTLWCHWCLEVQVLMSLQSSMSQGHHSKTVLLSCFVSVSPQNILANICAGCVSLGCMESSKGFKDLHFSKNILSRLFTYWGWMGNKIEYNT